MLVRQQEHVRRAHDVQSRAQQLLHQQAQAVDLEAVCGDEQVLRQLWARLTLELCKRQHKPDQAS